MCFDGFGPFRWFVPGKPEDLKNRYHRLPSARRNGKAPIEIQQQMQDNIQWIKGAQENKLVVGSQARILYADAEGRVKILPLLIRLLKGLEPLF
jgi:urocanate hydratase